MPEEEFRARLAAENRGHELLPPSLDEPSGDDPAAG